MSGCKRCGAREVTMCVCELEPVSIEFSNMKRDFVAAVQERDRLRAELEDQVRRDNEIILRLQDEAKRLSGDRVRLCEALDQIVEWRPKASLYCQGCYSETERIAERALLALEHEDSK